MSDTTLDPKQVEQIAEQKAQAKLEELKSNLVSSLSGKKPETPPESWSSLKEETAQMAVKQAEEHIFAKLDERAKEEEKKREAEKVVTEQQAKANSDKEWADQSAQWQEAVTDGILPPIKPEVAKVVDEWQKGGRAPTPEEFNDPGLVAFREAKALHDKMKSEGKSTTFYRTIEKFYNKRPAGASAPVMGATRAVGKPADDDYAEVSAHTKKYFRTGRW